MAADRHSLAVWILQRDSILTLFRAHAEAKDDKDRLPHLSSEFQVTVTERSVSLEEVVEAARAGKILEAFGTGTAAVLCPIKR